MVFPVHRRGFNRDRFFYGYAAEAIFQQTFPQAKKTSGKTTDFIYNDYIIEIGRSRVLEKQIIVYFRKFFYNIDKEHHKWLKQISPEMAIGYTYKDPSILINDMDKCLFIYFTKSLKYFTIFDYERVINSELKKKRDGEYYFDVRGDGLIPVKDLYKTVHNVMGIKGATRIGPKKEDFGVLE